VRELRLLAAQRRRTNDVDSYARLWLAAEPTKRPRFTAVRAPQSGPAPPPVRATQFRPPPSVRSHFARRAVETAALLRGFTGVRHMYQAGWAARR